MNKAKLLLCIGVFSLASCAGYSWYKPGATEASFAKDQYACIQSSQQQVSGTRGQWDGRCNCMIQVPFTETQMNQTLYDACMGSKGYTKRANQR